MDKNLEKQRYRLNIAKALWLHDYDRKNKVHAPSFSVGLIPTVIAGTTYMIRCFKVNCKILNCIQSLCKKIPALNVAMQNNTKQHFFRWCCILKCCKKSAIFLFQYFFCYRLHICFPVNHKRHFSNFRFLNPNFFLFEF